LTTINDCPLSGRDIESPLAPLATSEISARFENALRRSTQADANLFWVDVEGGEVEGKGSEYSWAERH